MKLLPGLFTDEAAELVLQIIIQDFGLAFWLGMIGTAHSQFGPLQLE